jgi:LuxR family maltose regulon positive regulatory protein
MIYTGDLDEGARWLRRAERALETDAGPGISLLAHIAGGMLQAGCGRLPEALQEFGAAENLRSQLTGSHVLANQVTGWRLATQARLGMTGQARAELAKLDDEQASAGEIGNARAMVCLADGDPAGALGALRDVLDGTAPVIGYLTIVESELLAGLAHRDLGDQRAANQATERALALAEPDRPVLPFLITDSRGLLEALPRHETAHAALIADILDVMSGGPAGSESPPVLEVPPGPTEPLSPGELKVLGYLPTNLSRQEIARDLSVSLNTVSTHIRSIYAKLGVRDRSSAVRRARELRLLAVSRHASRPG